MGHVVEQPAGEGFAPGTVIDGRYRVVRYLGGGGGGLVHEVEHVLTGGRFALKSLRGDEGQGRLEQEARATALVKSRHAVKITDMGVAPGAGPYLVMELLEGQSLRALLDDAGQLPLELTAGIALQIGECLAEAHAHGIIHRDLKPENVFLCGDGAGRPEVKVLDFGVVKVDRGRPIPQSSLTRTGSTVGTPYYMSLEQLRNASNVDARADVYALGVVVYECLAGRKPYEAETLGDLVYALCSGPPTHLGRLRPDLPGEVCDLVMRALASNRDERPASMAEVAAKLAPYADPALAAWLRLDRRLSGAKPRTVERAAAPASSTSERSSSTSGSDGRGEARRDSSSGLQPVARGGLGAARGPSEPQTGPGAAPATARNPGEARPVPGAALEAARRPIEAPHAGSGAAHATAGDPGEPRLVAPAALEAARRPIEARPAPPTESAAARSPGEARPAVRLEAARSPGEARPAVWAGLGMACSAVETATAVLQPRAPADAATAQALGRFAAGPQDPLRTRRMDSSTPPPSPGPTYDKVPAERSAVPAGPRAAIAQANEAAPTAGPPPSTRRMLPMATPGGPGAAPSFASPGAMAPSGTPAHAMTSAAPSMAGPALSPRVQTAPMQPFTPLPTRPTSELSSPSPFDRTTMLGTHRAMALEGRGARPPAGSSRAQTALVVMLAVGFSLIGALIAYALFVR